jgi:hypothetical protein
VSEDSKKRCCVSGRLVQRWVVKVSDMSAPPESRHHGRGSSRSYFLSFLEQEIGVGIGEPRTPCCFCSADPDAAGQVAGREL